MPGTVVAADAVGGVGEALQGDAAAQLQTFPPVKRATVRKVAWSSLPHLPTSPIRLYLGSEARQSLTPYTLLSMLPHC